MVKICIDCSGTIDEWVNGRNSNNPVHTDFCSVCGHRREVINYSPDKPLLGTVVPDTGTCEVCKKEVKLKPVLYGYCCGREQTVPCVP